MNFFVEQTLGKKWLNICFLQKCIENACLSNKNWTKTVENSIFVENDI